MKKDVTSIEPKPIEIESSELKKILEEQIQEIHEKTEEKLKETRASEENENEKLSSYRYDSYYRGGLNE